MPFLWLDIGRGQVLADTIASGGQCDGLSLRSTPEMVVRGQVYMRRRLHKIGIRKTVFRVEMFNRSATTLLHTRNRAAHDRVAG